MKRLISKRLQDWIANGKKSLLVSGARQVGKTYSIRAALAESGRSFIEFNFLEDPSLRGVFESKSAKDLVAWIRLYSSSPLPNGSFVFLDEVQECPELITKIKFLVNEGTFHYVLSGSLLGVTMRNIASVPIGYMDEITMYPMDFFEFALAKGNNPDIRAYLIDCLRHDKEIDETIHRRLMGLFVAYLLIGGMPEAVASDLANSSLAQTTEVQKQIIRFYRRDFSKYEQEDKRLRLLSLYDAIPEQLNKPDLRFVFHSVDKNYKSSRYEDSLLWLVDSGVAYPCYNCQEPRSPLLMATDRKSFRLFLNDSGLLASYFPPAFKRDLLKGANSGSWNLGAIYENFVATQLKAADLPVYYYKSHLVGELDFVTEDDKGVTAIEVKSGSGYRVHRSLDKASAIPNWRLSTQVVFSPANVSVDGAVRYWPIYCASLLKEVNQVDLSFVSEEF